MTLKQYPEGSRFTGVVGRTADESSPAWPTVPRAPKGSPPTSCSSCWMTRDLANWDASAARLRHRISTR
jgi:hypothetical protein